MTSSLSLAASVISLESKKGDKTIQIGLFLIDTAPTEAALQAEVLLTLQQPAISPYTSAIISQPAQYSCTIACSPSFSGCACC